MTREKSFQNARDKRIPSSLKRILRTQPGILLAFLFGSAAQGLFRPESDIDLAVLFSTHPDPKRILKLKQGVADLVGRDVDLAILNSASPILKKQVLKKGLLILQKDKKTYGKFFVDTLNQYDDLKRVRRVCEEGLLKGRVYA